MRKSLAIFFLFIILLNTAGYYLVFEGWKWHNSIAWSFDENNSDQFEVIVEIPLTVPYVTQEKDWEQANGQFEHKGNVYRIVKQKLTLDAVFISCVKDNEGTRINDQLEDFVKTFSDKPVDAKQSVKSVPGFMKEYVSQIIAVKTFVAGWSLTVEYMFPSVSRVPSYFASIVHPPERA